MEGEILQGTWHQHREEFLSISRQEGGGVCSGEACDNQIDMVFNKKRRRQKDWLGTYDRGSYLDTSNPQVSYTEFINQGLILQQIRL